MRRLLALLLLVLPVASFAAWNACRPLQVSKAPTLSTDAKACVNELGVYWTWQCLQNNTWVPYVAVVRWDYVTTGMRKDFDAWVATSKDPSDLRAIEAKYHTGNADTDPSLLAVRNAGGYCWTP